jgi:hypothetical protein
MFMYAWGKFYWRDLLHERKDAALWRLLYHQKKSTRQKQMTMCCMKRGTQRA